jgi:HK97 gp10 family phage protein
MFNIVERRTNRKVFLQVKQVPELTQRGIRQGFFKVGAALVADIRQEVLKKDKRGRVYIRRTRSGARRRHRASAPGQTPANRTGNYRKNAGYQIKGSDQMEFGIRDGAPYGTFLENGTRRMSPRPGLGNTVKKKERDAEKFFQKAIEESIT